ncbi:MAG TPA: hypothetical protein VHD87_02735 [Acidimicrobiales bacterium]|nr:hypothetical protein [Acidimicrobiales bacterium]
MHEPDFDAVMRQGDIAPPDGVIVHARRLLNVATRGRFEVHYETRTVVLDDIDGDMAMRIQALLAEFDPADPTSARWAEGCDPRTASAASGWVTHTPARVLGSRWRPERLVTGGPRRRLVVAAACRLLEADLDPATPEEWEPGVVRDYLTVLTDLSKSSRAPIDNGGQGPDGTGDATDDTPEHDSIDDTGQAAFAGENDDDEVASDGGGAGDPEGAE